MLNLIPVMRSLSTSTVCLLLLHSVVGLHFASSAAALEERVPEFTSEIAPLLSKYCTGCHNTDDMEGDLSLESFADLQQGVETGPVFLPGQSESSRLIRVLTGAAKPSMPPEDNKAPSDEEVALLRAWIDGGAIGPDGDEPIRRNLIVPSIEFELSAEDSPVTAIALSPSGRRVAVGRFSSVELRDIETRKLLFSIRDLPGKVNAIHFSSAGDQLVVATGVGGLYGRAIVYDARSGAEIFSVSGHRDILTDAELSPDGSLLATASYDKNIVIWDRKTGRELRNLSGHNGAIFDIAFNSDGNVLASASADETVKLWSVSSGERLDTLGQGEAEQYAVAFSPDGDALVAGGADKRIRIWQFLSRDSPKTNPLRYTRLAHDGAVTALAFTADGRTLITAGDDHAIKFWQTRTFAGVEVMPTHSALVNDLSAASRGNEFVVGRIDGTWDRLAATTVEPIESTESTRPSNESITVGGADADVAVVEESEPNDSPRQANFAVIPSKFIGVVHAGRDGRSQNSRLAPDRDMFRFRAKAGQTWILEIDAARSGSPLDSKLEILTGEGEKIERVVLQAVRDTYLKYQGQSSDTLSDVRLHNWEEMDINDYVYLNGEVVKLWHYPRGVDSGYMVYPGTDKRFAYFGTTAVTHALNESAYTVVPHSPGTKLVPSSLPVFPIYYENDDEGKRQLGADSYLRFVAPADGEYLAVVSDVRGFGGESYNYELNVRRPQPSFEVSVELDDTSIDKGSGREFLAKVVRKDGFAGEVRVAIEGLPAGFFASSPVVIQAEQSHAYGTINLLADSNQATSSSADGVRITSSAEIRGELITNEVAPFGALEIGKLPKVKVSVTAKQTGAVTAAPLSGQPAHIKPIELVIAPGETISAVVRLQREAGFEDEVKLGVDLAGRNLPHGVYIDNIGLNGLLVTKGSNEREFFITAAQWVPETTRRFHLRAELPEESQAEEKTKDPELQDPEPQDAEPQDPGHQDAEQQWDYQTSWPVVLHVRNPVRQASVSSAK